MTTYDADGLHATEKVTMRTYTGKTVDPFTMTAQDVSLRDITHSLAYQCRYSGHSVGYLSVARHSLHVARWLQEHRAPSAMILAGLLHDAAEAYIGDVIRPIKHRPEFAFFRDLDDRVTAVILEHFKLPWRELPALVHEADQAVTLSEVHFTRFGEFGWNPPHDEQDFTRGLLTHLPEDLR